MRNIFTKTLLLAAAILALSVFATAQSVSGKIGNGSVVKGIAARATVTLNIPGGLHVNSSRPGSEYAIPTTVTARSAGVKVSGVSYPRGRNRKFSFSENTINVYEGRATFSFNVTVPATFRGKTVSVNVAVRYQACTDEVCYAPKTKNVTLTAQVK